MIYLCVCTCTYVVEVCKPVHANRPEGSTASLRAGVTGVCRMLSITWAQGSKS